jgi:Fe2+ or Zn2+ uptake regulation protein
MIDFTTLLRSKGLKATNGRITILKLLSQAKKPLSIETIKEKLNTKLDQATLYRIIIALKKIDVVRKVSLGHAHAHYELVLHHHHHAICEQCEKVVDVSTCDTSRLETQVRGVSGFAKINHHSLEFFGICSTCIKKQK